MNCTGRRLVLVGILGCVLCLAYFYMLDRMGFYSDSFSPIFQLLFTVYDLRTAWLALAVCLLAALWNRPAPALRLVDWLARHPAALAFASAALLACGAIFIDHNYPLSMDEYAAVFQAKIFAAGRVFAQLPPALVDWLVVPDFNGSFLIASPDSGRAIEGYWPGFALLLAPFELLGVPWLCNASLAGLAVYLIFRITLDITGERRAAGWAILFTLSSGVFAATAMSYYSMQAHLTANLLFAWLLMRPTTHRALAAGLVGSLALLLHNPFPHTLFALPWIVAMAIEKDHRRYLLPLAAGYLPLAAGIGVGWLMLRASIAPPTAGTSTINDIAGGVFVWPDAGMLSIRIASACKMWIWAVPCVFVLAFMGWRRQRGNRAVRLLTQSAMLTFVGYLFVRFDQGHGWGSRYFHSAWGAIPVLAACAMTGGAESDMRLISFAGALAVLNLLVVVPFQMNQMEGFIARHLAQIPAPSRPGNNVYFVRPDGGFYIADMVQVDPLLRAPDLLLFTRGARLDGELVRQNWPNAVRLNGNLCCEQWNLGAVDQRRSLAGSAGGRHFVLRFDPPSPTPQP